jgi:hypothetical protein
MVEELSILGVVYYLSFLLKIKLGKKFIIENEFKTALIFETEITCTENSIIFSKLPYIEQGKMELKRLLD